MSKLSILTLAEWGTVAEQAPYPTALIIERRWLKVFARSDKWRSETAVPWAQLIQAPEPNVAVEQAIRQANNAVREQHRQEGRRG